MKNELPQEALDLIKEFEGVKLEVYKDAAGFPTIGTGHLIKDGEVFDTITMEENDALLAADLKWAKTAVGSLVTVMINDFQFGALVSFVFNVGSGNFRNSTMRRMLNESKHNDAAGEFRRWNRAGGRVLRGLTRRRKAEAALFRRV